MRDNIEWILEKGRSWEFKEEDDVRALVSFVLKNSKKICKGNKDLPVKFDKLFNNFLNDQSERFKNLKLKDHLNAFT